MKKLGLSLSGGGVKGVIYLGLIKLLQENNIPIHVIGGLSAGAIVSGLIAAGKTITEIEDIIDSFDYKKLMDKNPFDGIEVLDQKKVVEFLREILGDIRIEECKTKLIIFATNLQTKKLEIIKSGDLVTAMVASSCFPILMQPLEREGNLLAEGGFTVRFGAKYFREEGAEYVIGADVDIMSNYNLPGLVNDLYLSLSSSLQVIADYELNYDPVDLIIKGFDNNVGIFEFKKMKKELIEVGYSFSKPYLEIIKKSINKKFLGIFDI